MSENGLRLIDREWEYRGRFSVATLLLRHFDLVHDDPAFLEFLLRHFPKRRDPLVALLEKLGIRIDDATVREFVEVHDEIRRVVFPWGEPMTTAKVYGWLRRPPLPRRRSYVERALRKGLRLLRASADRTLTPHRHRT